MAKLPVQKAIIDPAAIRQLFANLIGNCAKYARPGAAPHVEVGAHVRGDRVVVEVRDHGIGVAEEDRERIFDRFERSGDPILVVRQGDSPAPVTQLFRCIAHDNRMAREGKHLNIVIVVTDGHDLGTGNPAIVGPPLERMALGAFPI